MSTSEQDQDERSVTWLEEEVARLRAGRKSAVDETDRYWSEILYLRKMVRNANDIIRAAAPPEMKSLSWTEIGFALIGKSQLRQELVKLEAEFGAAGGRGIELAERIDELRAELEDNS